jgi:hypothetical protein
LVQFQTTESLAFLLFVPIKETSIPLILKRVGFKRKSNQKKFAKLYL